MRGSSKLIPLVIFFIGSICFGAKVQVDTPSNTRGYFKEASDGLSLRKLRRVGLGLQAGGATGLGGLVMELNFTPNWGGSLAYGGGSNYQAVAMQGKYVLNGTWLLPYLTLGYTRWMSNNANGPIDRTTPSVLGDKLLNEGEKSSGKFSKDLFFPSLGAQFVQLTGPWAGASLYVELTILLEISELVAAPTGTLGLMYYF